MVVAVVDVGATTSTVSVLVDGRASFSREQAFGSQRLVNLREQRSSAANAEPPLLEGQVGGETVSANDGLDTALQSFNEALIGQVSQSLRFFFSSTHYSAIDSLLLMGRAAATRGLADAMGGSLGVQAAIADPFADMRIASKVDAGALTAEAPALAIACGAALRSFR